jgi:hypothetical protein
VGEKILATTKKSTSESLKCEGDVDSFFDWKGIVHHKSVPRGETVNNEFYLKVMKRLREAVRRKRPEAWTNKTWMHLLTRRFLSVNFWRSKRRFSCPSPPYSPDLAPAEFFLFLKVKSTLNGRRFQTVDEIKENSLPDLRAIP